MTSKPFARLAGAAAAGLLLLAACGGDDEGSTDDTATTVAGGDATTTTAAADETTTTTAATLEDPTDEVTAAYTDFFFNFNGDVSLLEDGESFSADVLEGMRATAATAGEISVTVHSVTALDEAGCDRAGVASPCAEVNFDLNVAEQRPAVGDQTGYAVQVDGTWKVAKTTFCSLASLGGAVPESC